MFYIGMLFSLSKGVVIFKLQRFFKYIFEKFIFNSVEKNPDMTPPHTYAIMKKFQMC